MTITEVVASLRSYEEVLILTHTRPDGDTVGSAAALCAGLRAMGKTACLLDNPELTKNQLPYFDPYAAPPDFQPQTVIAVDTPDLARLQINAGKYQNRVDLLIDHHPSCKQFGRQNFVRWQSASCGEIIYDILHELVPLTPEIALPLYVAVSTDTGGFIYSNTTAETHRVAAELISAGIDYRRVNKVFFQTKTKIRMQLEALMLQNAAFYDSDRVAFLTVTMAMKDALHAAVEDTDNLTALGALIEGVDCAVTLQEIQPDIWRCSLRTGSRINASEVCARLGGGGHAAAAGATIAGNGETVRERVLTLLEELVPDFKR